MLQLGESDPPVHAPGEPRWCGLTLVPSVVDEAARKPLLRSWKGFWSTIVGLFFFDMGRQSWVNSSVTSLEDVKSHSTSAQKLRD